MTATTNGRVAHLDLDAKRKAREAAATEAGQTGYAFTFGGQEFYLANAKGWPANAKALAAEGEFVELLEVILDRPKEFWAVKPPPTVADVTDLLEAWGEWSGVGGLGESVASPPPVSTLT